MMIHPVVLWYFSLGKLSERPTHWREWVREGAWHRPRSQLINVTPSLLRCLLMWHHRARCELLKGCYKSLQKENWLYLLCVAVRCWSVMGGLFVTDDARSEVVIPSPQSETDSLCAVCYGMACVDSDWMNGNGWMMMSCQGSAARQGSLNFVLQRGKWLL